MIGHDLALDDGVGICGKDGQSVPVGVGQPSLLISELIFHLRGRRRQYAYRTLFVIPIVIPSLVLLLVWGSFYRSDGLLNNLLASVGLGGLRHDWLSDPGTALYSLIFLGFPYIDAFNFLLLYAGLQAIPKSLIEAAAIDGARPWRRFLTVTLPLLSPTTFFLLVVNIVYVFFDTLGVIDAITGGGPAKATETLVYKVYTDGRLGGDLGGSAAQSVVLMAMVVALTSIQFRYVDRKVAY